MKMTILGSGTINSAPKRNAAGYLLQSQDQLALMDCGPGILNQLSKTKIAASAIQTLFISHFHLDHCADVFPLLLNRYLTDPGSNRNLTIVGPVGLNTWFNTQAKLQDKWLKQAPPVLFEWAEKTFYWSGYRIEAMRTLHTANSLAFLFKGDKNFIYSGDTGYSEFLIKFAHNADTALVECSYPDHLKKDAHLTPTGCAAFATNAHIQRLILTHIYPENDTPRLTDLVARNYPGTVLIANDLDTFEV